LRRDVGRDVVELVDHRHDQAAPVGVQQLLQVTLRLGDLDVPEPDGFEVGEELRLQLVAVDQHEHRRILEDWILDEALGDGDHRVGLARPLRVPTREVGPPRPTA